MSVQEWTPDTPYLKALQAAPRAARYAEYLKLRTAFLTSPSFFLDCASFFFKEGQALCAKRILSNLGELELEDASLLRIWAYRLREAGELDDAVEVLRTVLSQRPEEAQSHRDLALTLIERFEKTKSLKDAQEAVDELWHVIRVPDPRSQIGGHVTQDYTQGYGPEEYTLRDAPRGKYQV